MKLTRQQLLLGALILTAVVRAGDYVLSSVIQGPLRELEGENNELREEIKNREALLAEAREAGKQIELLQQRSLPDATETARSLYRNWLLQTVRTAKLRNAVVDSGAPANRRGLYRTMPFNVQARGSLSQITTAALYDFEMSGQLHRIVSLRLMPVASSGQFDLSMSVEAVIIPGTQRQTLTKAASGMMAFPSRSSYDVIARDNVFGVGLNQQDPMKLTILSAVTFRNGKPTAWITEQIDNRVHQLAPGTEFETPAMNGRVIDVDDRSVTIESGEQRLRMSIGQSFADAVAAPES